jgi:glycosyltransferase involved in cell wall biosynthesis
MAKSEAYDIDVITMDFRGLPNYESVTPNFRVHRVNCLRSRRDISQPWELAIYLVSGFLKANQLIRKQQYDRVHCHFIIPTGILGLLIKWRFGLPYVISAHGSDVPGYNPDRFTLLHTFTRPLLKLICHHSERIIALSHYLKDLIRRKIAHYDDEKLIVIPNGIDAASYLPLAKEGVILSTGRLLPRKGFQSLIAAVSEDDIGYELHIAGDGPMANELQSISRSSKTPVIFHGWIDNCSKEYKELLGKASIYCLVSKSENASVALLEAMSAGCAVITSTAPGCIETVDRSGLTIPYDNVSELRKVLVDLIGSKEKQSDFGQLARERILANYQWDPIIKEYTKYL